MPHAPWGRIWITVLAIVVVGVIALEGFVRRRGYEPSIKDDAWAWAWERGRVDGDPHSVAIVGGSRVLLAFDGEAWRAAAPGYPATQLAIDATQPVAALRDLAADPDFRGIALVDIGEFGFLEKNWSSQAAYVDAYHRGWVRSPGAMAERWLATLVQSHVALVTAGGPRAIEGVALHGAWPTPRYVVTHGDRTRFANFDRADQAKLARTRSQVFGSAGTPPQGELDAVVAEALLQEPYIRQIQARGGQVVYLRMPTCGSRWADDELVRPKAQFWDRLAAQTHAVAIHFKDYPSLSHFECPDLSHLDSRDGAAFTRALADILVERGVIVRQRPR